MGQIIKRLRKERNFTQDELAEQLNISTAAISKWENDASMPDISQVVPLATVFGVSTDVLFGTFGTNDDEEVIRIIDDASKLAKEDASINSQEKFYAVLLDALKRYPNNLLLLINLLGNGCNLARDYKGINDSRADGIFSECVREAELIINYSKDTTQIMSAHKWLVRVYCDLGLFDKAREHAKSFPNGYGFTAGEQLANIYGAEKKTDDVIAQCCKNINLYLISLKYTLCQLGSAYFIKGKYEDALFAYQAVSKMIPAIYGDEIYVPPLHVNSYINAFAASCCIKLNRIDEAMDILEKNYDYVIAQNKYYNIKTKLDTPLLRECNFTFFGNKYNAKETLKNDFNDIRFDPIRDNPRFIALLGKVDALPE
jgi:Predicted transcriptional regulators